MISNKAKTILTQGGSAKILMPLLKKLDPEDAIVLLKIGRKVNSPLSLEDRYRLKKLENLELVEKKDSAIHFIEVLFFAGFAGVLMLSFSLYSVRSLISEILNDSLLHIYSPQYLVLFLFWVVPMVLYFLFTFGVIKKLRRGGVLTKITRKLSWLGHPSFSSWHFTFKYLIIESASIK